MIHWFRRLGNRCRDWVVHHGSLLADPESMVAWFIITLWCVLAGLEGGLITMLILLAVGWFVHAAAVESGSHALLWLATAMVLVLVVVTSQFTFDGLPPVLLAAGGATALAHNELVRLNYARRRNAQIHEAVYHASGLALASAVGVGVIGVALVQAFANGGQRTWLWMPAAVGLLMLVGFGLSLGPLRRANDASKERWLPGGRIPPQPLKGEPTEF
ncbi:MAG: hypothetical protein AAF531_11280 [Actinomycetota bacterium]